MRTLHLYFICLLCFFVGFSQEQLTHAKKNYVSEDGKLYWQADQPVYLFASESPDGANAKRLESEVSKPYANPIYLDTEGVNWVRTRWAVDPETRKPIEPQTEVMFEIYRDGTAPKLSIELKEASRYSDGTTVYYGKGLSVNNTSSDVHAGVESIYASKNGGAYSKWSNAETLSSEGSYVYKFYGVDNVGNVSDPMVSSFTVDLTAPVTSHKAETDFLPDVYSPRTRITLTSNDNLSGVKSIVFTIDGGQEMKYSAPLRLGTLSEGDHTITYYATDRVGNKEEAKSISFFLDKSSPEVSIAVTGDQYETSSAMYVSNRTKVELSSTDNKAGNDNITYVVGRNEATVYSAPFNLPDANGNHTVTYHGTDKVNNNYATLGKPEDRKKKTYYLDNVPPTISYDYQGSKYLTRDTMFITSETDIILYASDKASGVKKINYSMNGAAEATYTKAIRADKEGFYSMDYSALDNVNNKKADAFFFRVDNTGPTIEPILSSDPVGKIELDGNDGPLNVYPKGVKLYLGATDAIIDTKTIYYQLNDGKEQVYTAPITLNNSGVVSYSVRAVDHLGNETRYDKTSIFVN